MFHDCSVDINRLEKHIDKLFKKVGDLEDNEKVYYDGQSPYTFYGGFDATTIKTKLDALYTHFKLEFTKIQEAGKVQEIKTKKGGN